VENYSRRNHFDYLFLTQIIVVTIITLLFSSTLNIGDLYAIQTSIAASSKTIIPSIKITFPPVGQQVPIGNTITIFGTSKYNTTDAKSCAVYANVNNYEFQKATSVGPHGNNDYSSWMYTYVNNDRPIGKGINSLGVKLSCNTNSANMTVYNTTRVVGIVGPSNHNQYYYDNNNNNVIYRKGGEGVLPGNNNSSANSSPPFWFFGGSNYVNNNGMNNINSSSNSDTTPIQTEQQPSKALKIYIKVSNDSAVWGNEESIRVLVLDRESSHPISNAVVTGNIVSFPADRTGLTKSFVAVTNNSGEASYSWLIPDTDSGNSVYKILISASAPDYATTSSSTSFTPMSAAANLQNGNNQNNDANDTEINSANHNFTKNSPLVSTLHT
jgi:hypothetical protein